MGLAHEYFISIHSYGDAAIYSLTATKAWVRLWKRFAAPVVYFQWPDMSYDTGYMAEAFTAWGYNSSPLPAGMPAFPSQNVVTGNEFDWRWMPYHP
jgi:hypothetical protein